MNRSVTENDFRRDEFKHEDPKNYEFRKDGAIVRKDRWELGIRNIASKITGGCREFEIQNLIDTIDWLMGHVQDMEK